LLFGTRYCYKEYSETKEAKEYIVRFSPNKAIPMDFYAALWLNYHD